MGSPAAGERPGRASHRTDLTPRQSAIRHEGGGFQSATSLDGGISVTTWKM